MAREEDLWTGGYRLMAKLQVGQQVEWSQNKPTGGVTEKKKRVIILMLPGE